MNKTVRQYIRERCVAEGWGDKKETLAEYLGELDPVYEKISSRHRWYNSVEVVVKSEDLYISYTRFDTTGDTSAREMGIEIDIDKAKFVERKERVVTEVYYE